ncbi:MAG: XdhC family protein [Tolypothrix carrinoi HA7290-LM1]|jgi:xanthine/CO dehydrogenase XdhC/CoxF family maturation factor|nr:XdhC family protein [Tolypothrix carrinoi HA7290-LM1]
MNELQAILNAFDESQKNGETSYLATVVNTKGSTYRRPGAKMLMTNTGKIIGAISGGCLENDVFQHTRQNMHFLEPIVVTYDNTADEDIVWGFGLGCNGVVQVLIERLDVERKVNAIAFIAQCLNNQQRGVIATVFSVEDALNVKVGSRLILNYDNSVITDIEQANLTKLIIQDAEAALYNQQTTVKKYQLSGSIEVLIEVIQPPTRLIIYGAERDAVPVVNFAKALGWDVTVIDCRSHEATTERLAIADKVILTRREIVHKEIAIDENAIAVVMTHNYLDDLEIMKTLLPSPARYIGILGPKQRTEKLLQDLEAEKITYSKQQLEKLYAPIGIDTGADTPEEIALSIIAEIQTVLAKRSGGFLRNRNQPIH